MGNRDKRNDKVKKPKKDTKLNTAKLEVSDLPAPVEVVRKKRKEPLFDEN